MKVLVVILIAAAVAYFFLDTSVLNSIFNRGASTYNASVEQNQQLK